MYAVIQTGGKQYRVEEGQQLAVERLSADGDLQLAPVLVVDGDRVLATPAQLEGASVKARVVGDELGPKIRGFTYKSKSNQRRHWGHRQQYSTIEITAITTGGTKTPAKKAAAKKAPAKASAQPDAEPTEAAEPTKEDD